MIVQWRDGGKTTLKGERKLENQWWWIMQQAKESLYNSHQLSINILIPVTSGEDFTEYGSVSCIGIQFRNMSYSGSLTTLPFSVSTTSGKTQIVYWGKVYVLKRKNIEQRILDLTRLEWREIFVTVNYRLFFSFRETIPLSLFQWQLMTQVKKIKRKAHIDSQFYVSSIQYWQQAPKHQQRHPQNPTSPEWEQA